MPQNVIFVIIVALQEISIQIDTAVHAGTRRGANRKNKDDNSPLLPLATQRVHAAVAAYSALPCHHQYSHTIA